MAIYSRAVAVAAACLAAAAVLSPAAPAATATAAVTATQPATRYFEVGPTTELANTAQSQSIPELIALPSGDFVLGYLDGFWSYYGNPTFAIHSGSTGARSAGNFDFNGNTQWDTWANTTGRGAYTAVDGLGRVVRVSWGFGFPNSIVSIKVLTQTGSVAIGDTTVGNTPYQSSGAALAIGYNNSINIMHYDTQVRFSSMHANGTWIFRNQSIDTTASAHFAPKLAYNPYSNRSVAAWSVRTTDIGRVVGMLPNGSPAWNYTWTMDGANLTIAALPTGATLVAYAVGDGLHAFVLDANGELVGNDVIVDATAAGARAPRAVVMGDEELAVVYSDQSSSRSDLDVFALALNTTDLRVTIPATRIATDSASNTNPSAVALPDGSLWIGWQNETTTYYANLSGVHVWPRWTGFALASPEGAVTGVRGDPVDLPFTLTSLVSVSTEYDLAVGFSPYGGPTNWSGTVRSQDGSGPVPTATVAPLVALPLLARVASPVADPPGYGAIVSLLVTDRHRGGPPLTLRINVTIEAGHLFAVGPPDTNVSQPPGSWQEVPFTVSVVGTVDESGVPLTLSAAPPAGWTANLTPATLSGQPGQSVQARLNVTIPQNAVAGMSYCARLRVMNPNDSFSLSTAGFCVRVSLVATPTVTPGAMAVAVDPGAGVVTIWNFTNVGNAGSPIGCGLSAATALPSGWGVTVDPYTVPLSGGGTTTLVVTVSAPPLALGNTTLNVALRASCEGSADVREVFLVVVVRPVHSVLWRASGTSVDANASGGSSFTVTVENQGNVPEAVAATFADAPVGWTVATSLWVNGVPTSEVPAHETGTLAISVQAPSHATAGTYRVTLNLTAGGQASQGVAFDVRIPKVYGLRAAFTALPSALPSLGTLRIVALINHTANTGDTYALRVTFDDEEAWAWRALYTGPGGAASEVRGSIAFLPFESGMLDINATAPSQPSKARVAYRVNISSARGASVEYVGGVDILVPDLGISAEGVPVGRAGPFDFPLRVTVRNSGSESVPQVLVAVVIDGREVATGYVGPLGPGETGFGLLNISIDLAAGSHLMEVWVDPPGRPGGSARYGAIFERDESNNLEALPFVIGANEQAPPPPPPRQVATEQGGPIALIALAAIVAGTVLYAALRIRMRNKRD